MPTYGTSTKYALRKLLGSSLISDIDAGFAALADDVDANMAGYISGVAASRPAAASGNAGLVYRTSDIAGDAAVSTGAAWLNIGVPRVTALPTSNLYDGQIVDYVADATNSVIWRFRYNASGSTYKWEFVGGGPLIAAIDSASNVSRGDTTWVDLGLSFTLALAGEYEMALSTQLQLNSGAIGWLGVTIAGSSDGATGNAWSASTSATGNLFATLSSPSIRRTVTPAASVVKARGRGGNANSAQFADRSLLIRPIRVG